MPDPAGTKNNGGIKFVRQKISAKDDEGTATNYIVQKGSMKAGAKTVVQEDENGVENKQAGMKTIRTGNLSLTYVNDTDKPPAQFEEVTLKDQTGDDVTVILWTVDQDFGADSAAVVSCEIREKQPES